jgi:hypothetical protein
MTAIFGKDEPRKQPELQTVFGVQRIEPKLQIPQPLNEKVSVVEFGKADPVRPKR